MRCPVTVMTRTCESNLDRSPKDTAIGTNPPDFVVEEGNVGPEGVEAQGVVAGPMVAFRTH